MEYPLSGNYHEPNRGVTKHPKGSSTKNSTYNSPKGVTETLLF